MKIAVIGTGIAGLTAAYKLAPENDITVFEAENRLGGHTATVDVQLNGKDYAIDTGFIVFNEWTYPNFIALLEELGVEKQETEMSFSVSCLDSALEYGGKDLNTLFAQRRNLFSPYFLKLVKDILRFNKQSVADLQAGNIPAAQTLENYLIQGKYSEGFVRHYLIPMGSAIWSCGTKSMLQFPVQFFIRFFANHGLLSVTDRPQWYTLKNGSRSYLEPLTRSFKNRIRLSSPVKAITRNQQDISLTSGNGHSEKFDQVILACHSDQALSLLKDASKDEQSILGAIPYQPNEVVLHTDASLLPKTKKAWSSWNYRLGGNSETLPVLSYNMNILQGIHSEETFCVSLNASEAINPDRILGRYNYSHPQFSLAGIQAQQRWSEINGVNKTWFCGAYWANGFHEDGVVSALRVVEKINKALP
jgi:predicted NAD/FAD-binding protein